MDSMDSITKYFPALTGEQLGKLERLGTLYQEWNEKINVISRKDMEHFYERHVLHSLGIAKVIQFKPSTKVMDLGTGGGFPGIPMAILFPDTHFHLVDSIGKKIGVVKDVARQLKLSNVEAQQARVESLIRRYDFIVTRAVTKYPNLLPWIKGKFKKEDFNSLQNGLLMLKGGDVDQEMEETNSGYVTFHLDDYFQEEFFKTKKVVYAPWEGKR